MKFLLLFSVIIICACTNIEERHGATIKPKTAQKITSNISKQQVTSLLGSPSTKSTYGEEVWYYISNNKNQNLFSDDDMVQQEVLAIYFNEQEMAYNVETYGMRDAKEIELVDRKTPTAGHDLTVMEQLLGNVGRFVPNSLGAGRGSDPTGR